MAVTLTPVNTLNVGILGLGREGCKVVHAMAIPSSWDVSLTLWDCCRNSFDELPAKSSIKKRILDVNSAHGFGCIGQYDLGRSIFLNEQEHCREWLQDKDLVFVVGALGGGFTGGFFPEFAKLAKNVNTPLMAYTMLPFSFEGRKRAEGSKQVLAQLRENCKAAIAFEGDDFLSEIDGEGYAQQAVDTMNRECREAICSMLSLLFEDGLYEFDLPTLNAVFDLDVAKTIVVSSESSVEGQEVEVALEGLSEKLNSKLPDNDLRIDRLLINVVGGEQMAAGAVNQINKSITERFKQPGKTFFGASILKQFSGIRIVVYLSIHLGKQFEWSGLAPDDEQKRTVNTHTHSRKSSKKRAKERKKVKNSALQQEEEPQGFFDSIINESNRGYFDDTPANSWNGIDLDVPTYLRRGIRVK